MLTRQVALPPRFSYVAGTRALHTALTPSTLATAATGGTPGDAATPATAATGSVPAVVKVGSVPAAVSMSLASNRQRCLTMMSSLSSASSK